jgi:hypothetical protein
MSPIRIRNPESIYQIEGELENGSFHGRWHFSFGEYYDPQFVHFGTLRVFNDDTLSPGAVWPLHPHKDNEVVTYCADGEFRHADERGKGGLLKKGWVQHTTVGSGMWHSEINNLPDKPMRFIQMWFIPSKRGMMPSVEQKEVMKRERTNTFFPLVSNKHSGSLRILSDAEVYACFLEKEITVKHIVEAGRGAYLYVLEGGDVFVDKHRMVTLAAAMIKDAGMISVRAEGECELLLIDVALR